MKKYMKFKPGFTLAETLITLAIIGVCAAMMITSISLVNPKEQTNAIVVKKTITNFSNATMQVLLHHSKSRRMDGLYVSGLSGDLCKNSSCFFDLLSQHIQVTKKVQKSNAPANLNGEYFGELSDGVIFGVTFDPACTLSAKVTESGGNTSDSRIYVFPADKNSASTTSTPVSVENACGFIYYDTNGTGKPNVGGKDQFAIPVYKATGARVPTIKD